MISAILIDDEKDALEMLEWQLKQYCPMVTVMALCQSADEGIAAIKAKKPQLIFLDIEMPHKSGFELIKAFADPSFDIIFTTAYNQFALQAFKVAALDYLLKPIDAEDLQKTIRRFEKRQTGQDLKQQLEVLIKEYNPLKITTQRVALPTAEGIIFIDPQEITRAEASANYCTVFFTDHTKVLLAKTLKYIEELLKTHSFIRIHQTHLVNINYIAMYSKIDGGMLVMKDKSRLPISRQRREDIVRLLHGTV